MARTKTAAIVAREPTVVQRTARAIMRCVSWIVIAWFAFFVVRIVIGSARRHEPFPWVGFVYAAPGNALIVIAAATALCAMALVPYAYVVWPQPQRRFPGEGVAWYRVALGALVVGVLVGLVWGSAVRVR